MPVQNIKIILVSIVICLICFSQASLQTKVFRHVFRQLEETSLEPIEPDRLWEGALNGLTSQATDYPYTSYLAPREQSEYVREIQGQVAGIGVFRLYKDPESGGFYFIPIHKAPAERAGLKFGDRIMKVDDKDVTNLKDYEVAELIRGQEGTSVTLQILPRETLLKHSGSDSSSPAPVSPSEETTEPAEQLSLFRGITIVRQLYQQEIVTGDHRNADGDWVFTMESHPGIGYIRISQFTDTTIPDFDTAINTLKQTDIKSLILDLRDNPGGFLPAAVQLCDYFLAPGLDIVTTRHRNRSIKAHYVATKREKFNQWKLVILINEESASASEIVSGALQDHNIATIIGTRSYGKGTIQEIFPLPFRMGLLRITDASFWRPSGIPIHRWHDATENDTWGIFPNQGFEVPLTCVQKLLTGWLQDLRSSSRLDDLTVSTQIVLEQVSKIKTLLEQNPNAVQENMEAIQSPLHPSVLMDGTEPQGTAPYYDPQLDRAIVFLTAPDESVTHSASGESPAPPSPDPVSNVTESPSNTSDAPVPPVSRNPLNTSNKTGTEDMAVTSEHSNPDNPSVQ